MTVVVAAPHASLVCVEWCRHPHHIFALFGWVTCYLILLGS